MNAIKYQHPELNIYKKTDIFNNLFQFEKKPLNFDVRAEC